MNEIKIKLTLLYDILSEKENALRQILTICENHEYLITEVPDKDRSEIIAEMLQEKQRLIDIVLNCDSVFQSTFEGINNAYEENINLYKDQLIQIQNKIEKVMELDIKIRSQERNNRNISTNKKQFKTNSSDYDKSHILEQYKKSNKAF